MRPELYGLCLLIVKEKLKDTIVLFGFDIFYHVLHCLLSQVIIKLGTVCS